MLLFRSFAIGLSAACFALLVLRPAVVVQVTRAAPPEQPLSLVVPPLPSFMAGPALSVADIPTIVDVAPGMSAAQIAATVRLQPGEQITSVDDAPVTSSLGAGLLLANRGLAPHQFIDFGVSGPAGERRVLVLLH